VETEFKDLFVWNQDRIEDVKFWCEPELTTKSIHKIREIFNIQEIDGFVALEARGFYLAGIASAIYKLPCVMVRKHKAFYNKMDHESVHFKNWKDEPESLTIVKDTLPHVKSVLVVDDILDTGASLRASKELLARADIHINGAFYLLNSYGENASHDFGFSVHSLITKKLFT
jgi:adenine/guanine phosphoribosyltransferase-like PRPP-binding protein